MMICSPSLSSRSSSCSLAVIGKVGIWTVFPSNSIVQEARVSRVQILLKSIIIHFHCMTDGRSPSFQFKDGCIPANISKGSIHENTSAILEEAYHHISIRRMCGKTIHFFTIICFTLGNNTKDFDNISTKSCWTINLCNHTERFKRVSAILHWVLPQNRTAVYSKELV